MGNSSWAFLVAGGALTVAGSVVSTWLQAWIQRRGVREDRVWGRRAELYVDLLGATDFKLREGRTRAFASTKVRDLCEEILAAREKMVAYVNRGQGDVPIDEWEKELHGLIHAVTSIQSRLEGRIRSELRISEPKG